MKTIYPSSHNGRYFAGVDHGKSGSDKGMVAMFERLGDAIRLVGVSTHEAAEAARRWADPVQAAGHAFNRITLEEWQKVREQRMSRKQRLRQRELTRRRRVDWLTGGTLDSRIAQILRAKAEKMEGLLDGN